MSAAIAAMRDAFVSMSRGEVTLPLRGVSPLPNGAGFLGVMPSSLHSPATAAVKAITVVPANSATRLDSHQGAVLLFDAADGRLLAMLDAATITSIRTAAASAVATDLLARRDASSLAILGAGVEASTHLEAIAAVRPLRSVRVWARNPDKAAAFAARASKRHELPVTAASSAREAVTHADIICTVTASPEPILQGGWLAPGSHVNAVGSCRPNMREIDGETVRRARVFVDRRESAMSEAGDLLLAIAEGLAPADPIAAELGDVITGRAEGRRAEDEITLYESLGIAIQDLAAARVVFERARAAGTGSSLEFVAPRHG